MQPITTQLLPYSSAEETPGGGDPGGNSQGLEPVMPAASLISPVRPDEVPITDRVRVERLLETYLTLVDLEHETGAGWSERFRDDVIDLIGDLLGSSEGDAFNTPVLQHHRKRENQFLTMTNFCLPTGLAFFNEATRLAIVQADPERVLVNFGEVGNFEPMKLMLLSGGESSDQVTSSQGALELCTLYQVPEAALSEAPHRQGVTIDMNSKRILPYYVRHLYRIGEESIRNHGFRWDFDMKDRKEPKMREVISQMEECLANGIVAPDLLEAFSDIRNNQIE